MPNLLSALHLSACTRFWQPVATEEFQPNNRWTAHQSACLCSCIRHPHILHTKSLFRKNDLLFVVQEYANGGDLCSLAKRVTPHGLPERAVLFLIQQLVMTLIFSHSHGITLQETGPSKLLLSWSQKGLPILKFNTLQVQNDLWPQSAPSQVSFYPASSYVCD